MTIQLERVLALDRVLDDVRTAQLTLPDAAGFASWRGPARNAFLHALDELPVLLRSAEAALERARSRTMLAADRDSAEP